MHGRRAPVLMLTAAVAVLSAASAASADGPAAGSLAAAARQASTAHEGIWKAAVPPTGSMHGEFDSNDPVGVAAGARIAADCSINWVDPDTHKLYCFSSATSLVFFLEGPHVWLQRARKEWRGLALTD